MNHASIIPHLKAVPTPPVTKVTSDTGTFTLKPDGIYYAGFGKDGQQLPEKRISSLLKVLASTADEGGCNHGVLLEWRDNRNNLHKWAMPKELLGGDGVDIAKSLLGRGLDIKHGCKGKLLDYIQSSTPEKRLTSVSRTGWHDRIYVTSNKTYGEGADDYIYQSDTAIKSAGKAGTLEEWREHVAAYAWGNSRLILAISSAFAGTLIHLAGAESGGVHLFGGSSCGKTTVLEVSASVHGNPKQYKRTWRGTSNGLEGLAAAHNDGFLPLDEIKEAKAKDIAEVAYMFSNGQEKARQAKTTNLRDIKTWRLMILSTGELTLTEYLKSEGIRVYAGQEVRLASVPADAGRGYGLFEELHGMTGGELSEHIKAQSAKYYGVAGEAWLEHVTANYDAITSEIHDKIQQFKDLALDAQSSSQAGRVANRFGLIAYAGELATQYGLTGWNAGDATSAALTCFKAWLAEFGTGNREEKQILEAVKSFIDRNGIKFQVHTVDRDGINIMDVPDRVGFKTKDSDGDGFAYLVYNSQLERLAEGHSKTAIIAALKNANWLRLDREGKSSIKKRMAGQSERFFVIVPRD